MLLRFCSVGVTLSWGEAHPGARASRPHKSSRSFSHLLHRNQPAAAPCLCFGRAVGCTIAGKLSGNRRDSMRAGRPRSRGCRPDGEVGVIRRATSLKAGLSPLGNSRLPASPAPAPNDGADHSRKNGRSLMKTNHEWTPINTNRPEDRWTSFNDNWRQNASALLSRWCDPVMGGSPPRERGRPARTNPPAASAISSTGINRQRRPGSPSAGPMRFPLAGRSAATSQGN